MAWNSSNRNDVLIHTTLDIQKKRIDIVNVYAPDISKPKVERDEFYNQLAALQNTMPRANKLILGGDFIVRIGNEVVDGITHGFNEDTSNENSELFLGTCSQFELGINNTFYPHKRQDKITWSVERSVSFCTFEVLTAVPHRRLLYNAIDCRTPFSIAPE